MRTTENLIRIARRLSGNAGDASLPQAEATDGSCARDVTAEAAEVRLLFTLMNSTPDRIYFKDTESRFLLVNRALADFFGARHPDDVIGKTDFDFFSAEHARAAFEDEQRVIKTGQPIVDKEERETWPDGTVMWSSSTKAPLVDAEGRIVGTFGISRDITERRNAQDSLRASESRYRELLEAVPTYTYSVQLQDGRPVNTYHSAGCVKVTGYTPLEYAADPGLWLRMVHPSDRALVEDHVRRVLAFERVKPIEHRICHRDGSVFWVRNTIIHHRDADGRITRYDGLVEDITERKYAEQELQTTLAELDARVKTRTAELARANDELKVEVAEHRRTEEKLQEAVRRLRLLDEARIQLVSNVSHDLKAPLASLRFAVDNLLKGVAGQLPDPCLPYLSMMKRDTERLVRTVQDVLDFSRIETQSMVLRPARMVAADLVRQAVESLKIHAEAKQQQLTLRLEGNAETVEWDAEKMERVITNIVENAIKYTPKGGAVSVHLTDDAAHPGFVVVEVVDTGIGIAPEHIEKVMERYYRVAETVSGAGLGLPIAKEIVQMHGGWVKLVSPPPGKTCGTSAALYIPRVTPKASPATT